VPPAGRRTRRVVAGERGVAVAGDVRGSLIVTGDNNTFNLGLGPEAGALLEQLGGLQRPTVKRRRHPVLRRPPPFPSHLDRDTELERTLGAKGPALNVYGKAGIGKTYLLSHVANHADRVAGDGIVYLSASEMETQDLVEELFEAFYQSDPPIKPSADQLKRLLERSHALVLVDSFEAEPPEAQQLVFAAPNCRFVIGSRTRRVWDWEASELAGLGLEDSLVLIEQELGRKLEQDEQAAAEEIWRELDGHPLEIKQAAAVARESGRPLGDVAQDLGGQDAERRLTDQATAGLSAEERKLLTALILLRGASLATERLSELVGDPDASALLNKLERLGLVEPHSPRYSVHGLLVAHPPAFVAEEEESVLAALLESLSSWAERNRLSFQLLLEELPALLVAIALAWGAGRWREAIRLGKAIDGGLAWSRYWGAWRRTLNIVLDSARKSGDRSSEAWALHQLGTLAACVGAADLARESLGEAASIRHEQGEHEAASLSEHNLAVALGRPSFLARVSNRWLLHSPFTVLAGLLLPLVLVAGGLGAGIALARGGGGDGSTDGGGSVPIPVSISVNLTGGGSGQVKSVPARISCPSHCTDTFERGKLVVLQASARPGSRFVGWQGLCSGSESQCQFGARAGAVSASFELVPSGQELSVDPGDGQVVSNPAGIDCPSTCRATFLTGAPVELTANSTSADFVFDHWENCDPTGEPQCSVHMDSDRSVSAFFTPRPVQDATLRLTVLPGTTLGSVTTSLADLAECTSATSPCVASAPPGTVVRMTANPSHGWFFKSWDARCQEAPGPVCTIMLGQAGETTPAYALFRLPALTLKVDGGTLADAAAGISCSATCTIEVPGGTSLHLVGTPTKQSEVTDVVWGGLCAQAQGDSCNITMPSEDADISASISSRVG
jgi:hypothetical protein